MPILPRLRHLALPLTLLLSAWSAGPAQSAEKKAGKAAEARPVRTLDPERWKALAWREVGPYRGGRSAAVTGLPSDRNTYYFGATGGGVWKTQDGGLTWKSVSDGFFGGAIGAVAVSGWDPNVIYAGTGEETVRGNVSHGDGMWKSTDAGKTWQHIGLEDSRHIARVRIHPKNPDLVYAAVLGHLFGPNQERGVYRSKDGGKTWERVLFVNENAGAVDLVMDPANPRILYAGTWRVRRTPYSLESGGPGSGLWKSTDGGDTWTELTRNPGLPKGGAGGIGIVGVAVSPTNPDNVYANIEAEDGGVFRSRDGGKTWKKTNEDRELRQRAWYYTRIYADPKDEESVYVLNVRFHRSKDGGKTFTAIRVPHGDNHDLWIDPADPLRMIEGNDGGVNVSTDGGKSWTRQDNQPTAQIYRVSTDNHFPYRILGAQQDNSALRILSRPSGFGRPNWEPTAGGESGYIVADPENPDVVYGGSYGGFLHRLNHDTGEQRDVNVWPDDPMGAGAAELKYRFQWNFPIVFSPHDPNTLYAAGNVLFKSTDEGQSWTAISPDLTRDDKSTQGPSGGPITKDNTSVEYYGTIFTVAESTLEPGVIWSGSDDGLIHVTRDGGKTWKDVTPRDLPRWIQINSVEPNPFEKGGLYVAATMYKSDDFRPYLYKTGDYGATWTRIDRGIDPLHFTRVVRADPVRRGLLYAGTERGAYVSFDDGGRWEPLQLNLPIVPVTDMTVKGDDLIAATQGRGFWILGGLTNLRYLPDNLDAQSPHLFDPVPAHRLLDGDDGAAIYYFLDKAPSGKVAKEARLEILDGDGKVLRSFPGKPSEAGNPLPKEEVAEETEEKKPKPGEDQEEEKAPMEAGLNRFTWDLLHGAGKTFPGMILWSGETIRPFVMPGEYQVRLTVGGTTRTAHLQVLKDPRSSATLPDMQAQYDFLMSIRAKLDETHDAIRRIRDVRAQLNDLKERLGDIEGGDGDHSKVLDAAKALDEAMTKVEEALYQTKNRSQQDPLNFPIRLNDKLNALAASAAIGDNRPTDQAVQVRDRLLQAVDEQLSTLARILGQDLPALNELAKTEGIPAVILSPSRLK